MLSSKEKAFKQLSPDNQIRLVVEILRKCFDWPYCDVDCGNIDPDNLPEDESVESIKALMKKHNLTLEDFAMLMRLHLSHETYYVTKGPCPLVDSMSDIRKEFGFKFRYELED